MITGALGFAALSGAASLAKETEKFYRSPEFLGRGYAGLANPRDEDAIFYNPANIQGDGPELVRKGVVLSPLFLVSDTVQELSGVGGDETETLKAIRDMVGEPAFVGVQNFSGVLLQDLAFGLVNAATAGFFVYKDPDQGGVESVDLRGSVDHGLVASHGRRLMGGALQVGATGKLIRRTSYRGDITIADVDAIKNFKANNYRNSGVGLGLDLGVIYRLADLPLTPQLGATLTDLGDTSFNGDDSASVRVAKLPQTLNLGVTIAPPVPFGRSSLHFDLRDVLDREEDNLLKRIHLGGDYLVAQDVVGFTLGLNQGFLTSGLFLDTTYFRLDLGSYGEEVGERIGERSSRRYFLRLASTF